MTRADTTLRAHAEPIASVEADHPWLLLLYALAVVAGVGLSALCAN